MDERLQIVYVNPNGNSYFVREIPTGGGWEVVMQQGEKVRRAQYVGCNKAFPDQKSAEQALHLAVANDREKGSSYYKWDVLVNGKSVRYEDLYKYENGQLLPPPPVASVTLMTLGQIEFRIHEHVRGACEDLLAVGRLLNEAKDGGYVPHGQWAEWVRQHTGFNPRTAQRLMQTARMVPEGSELSRLPISQVQAILALPDPEAQNSMAQRVEDEGLTLRELQEEIRKAKESEERARKQVEILKDQNRELLGDVQTVREQLNARERAQSESEMEQARRLAESLAQEKLGNALCDLGKKHAEEMRAMEEKLQDAEAMADAQAESAQALRDRVLELESAQGRGDKPESAWNSKKLADAISRFLVEVGALPYMQDALSWPRAERMALIERSLRELDAWSDRMMLALSGEHVEASGEVR